MKASGEGSICRKRPGLRSELPEECGRKQRASQAGGMASTKALGQDVPHNLRDGKEPSVIERGELGDEI